MNWSKIKLLILALFASVLIIQLPVTLYVNDVLTLDFISYARILQLIVALVFIALSLKNSSADYLTYFLQLSILVQTITTIFFEPKNELVAFNFIAILIIIASTTYRGNQRKWFLNHFPPYLLALIVPLLFKDNSLSMSFSIFISNYLFGFFSLLVSTLIVVIFSNQEKFNLILKTELQLQKEKLENEFNKIQELKTQIEIGELATSVAHDIRSPLAALENILHDSIDDKNSKILAEKSVKRIKDIAEGLLEKNRSQSTASNGLYQADKLLENICILKRAEFPECNIEITNLAPETYVSINDIKFERLISNIINNSIEATHNKKSIIHIKLELKNNNIQVSIKDNGNGINQEIKEKLGKEKISKNKINGNGIGLLTASQLIKEWNGNLEISSEKNNGTLVTITLPAKSISNTKTMILVDNDELVRTTWKFRAAKKKIELLVFESSTELYDRITSIDTNSIFYVDSDLGDEKGENILNNLFDMGYLNLNLTTGYSQEKFSHLNFVKNVINKNPPF